jgi:hypothetical protein
MSDNSHEVMMLIRELLRLSRTDSTPAADPPSAEELEQRRCKQKTIRQKLVLALSLRGL